MAKKKRIMASLKLSKLAIASLTCGILAIFIPGVLKILLGLAALVLGLVAWQSVSSSHGMLYGQGMAIAGVVIGPLVLVIALVAGGISKAVTSRHHEKNIKTCASNLRKLGQALKQYTQEHNGRYPKSLLELFPKYIDDPAVFWCPGDKDSRRPKTIRNESDTLVSYKYTPPEPGDDRKLWQIQIISDNSLDNHDGSGQNVLMGDGVVVWISQRRKHR